MNLDKKYLIWGEVETPKMYIVDEVNYPKKVEDYEFLMGKSVAKRWGNTATLTMTQGDPKKPVFPDNLANTDSVIIVSERLKKALQAEKIKDVEFLPAKLADKKGKSFNLTYYILNFVNPPDCLDLKASKAEMNSRGSRVEKVKKLLFKKDPKKDLFKLPNYRPTFLDAFINIELAEKLAEQGFSGIDFEPLFYHPENPEDYGKKIKDPEINKKAKDLNKKLLSRKSEEVAPIAGAEEKPKEKMKVPTAELKALAKSFSKDAKLKAEGETFVFALGDKGWLEYGDGDDKDTWPDFDAKRYYSIGNNTNGNSFLLDLEEGKVVYFAHDSAYSEDENFEKVAKNLEAFKKMVKEKGD